MHETPPARHPGPHRFRPGFLGGGSGDCRPQLVRHLIWRLTGDWTHVSRMSTPDLSCTRWDHSLAKAGHPPSSGILRPDAFGYRKGTRCLHRGTWNLLPNHINFILTQVSRLPPNLFSCYAREDTEKSGFADRLKNPNQTLLIPSPQTHKGHTYLALTVSLHPPSIRSTSIPPAPIGSSIGPPIPVTIMPTRARASPRTVPLVSIRSIVLPGSP